MNLRVLIITGVIALSCSTSKAQDSGDRMFDDTFLHEIRIEFSQSNFWSILINNYQNNSDPFLEKPYLMGKVTIDGEEVDSVGVRLKGFSSYWTETDKKPLKIDFNEFVPGRRFDGLRKLNLNNSTGDASMQREVICYDLMRSSGVSAPRVSFSKVYLNDQYWGIYQSVEQVDKEFLQNNFSNDEGNLFKNLSWSKLEYNGDDVSDYDNIFSLKTNEEAYDWSGFINFVDVLNNSNDEDFKDEIEKVFNVDLFLKTLAVDVATDNWDSYLEHGRNWYMYEDTQTGLFHWIPWDYNFALPGPREVDEEECNLFPQILSLRNGTPSVQFYEDSFSPVPIESFYWDFGDGNTSSEREPEHTYESNGTYQVCLTIAINDKCEESNCEWINTNNNLYDCASVVDGSFPYTVGETFVKVLDFDPSCCQIWGEECEDIYDFFSGNGFTFNNFKIDQRENDGILIQRLLNEPEYFARYLDYFCNLVIDHFDTERYFELMDLNKELIKDAVESDPNLLATYQEFLVDIGDEGLKMVLSSRLDSLENDLAMWTSCSASPVIPESDIVINEFVASNDSMSMISDGAGEFDDWIEIYNNTNSTVDLSDTYLSDDPDNLLKWKFPNGTTIGKDGYKIVWADKNEDQPGFHSNFRLSKEGDQIYLTNSDGSNIDNVEFGPQTTNVSMARTPNGTGDFISKSSTFKANNDTGEPTSTNNLIADLSIKLYPNPATDYVEIEMNNAENEEYKVNLRSVSGQLVNTFFSRGPRTNLDLKNLSSGFYFVSVQDSKGNMTTSKFIKGK